MYTVPSSFSDGAQVEELRWMSRFVFHMRTHLRAWADNEGTLAQNPLLTADAIKKFKDDLDTVLSAIPSNRY